ncbi:MAG: ADP-ribosylglycohydrolase family protein [Melioribacteraceae bacterium]
MNVVKQRTRNAMIGLAIGDAMSWTAMFHRSFLLPQWTRRIRREIDSAAEKNNVIISPMPFSLNQPAQHFDLSPTGVTEWAAFTAEILLSCGVSSYTDTMIQKWLSLAQSTETIRGSISTQAALHNFKNGILPPQTGRENPHYFDDSAMCRSVPIGIICTGEPDKASRLAENDASVTNSEDGIWAAQAMAVAISLVSDGKNIKDAISIARQYLPKSSWIGRTVDEAMSITVQSTSIISVLPELHNKIVNREYSYGNVAPETLALTFAIAQLHGNNFETAVTSATAFAKSGETLPAMVGALVGAMHSTAIAGESWMNAIRSLKGICIPYFAGKNYLTIIEHLLNLEGQKISI